MTAVAVLGTMAAASSLLFVWPQVVRTARTGDVDGVSVAATLFAMAGYLMWILYGLRGGLPFVIAANLQAVIGFGFVVAMTVRRRPVAAPVWLATAAGLAFAIVVFVAAPAGLGALAVLTSAFGFLPQAVVALREPDLSGLSIWTYVLIGLSTSVWAAYGIAEGDPYLVAPTLVVLPCVLVIAARIRFTAPPTVELAAAD